MTKKIILASTSPRRKAILKKTGLKFTVVPSNYEEDMNSKRKPKELAKFLSRGKAENVSKRYKNSIVIGADTFVTLGSELLGKPKNEHEAMLMLKKVSGKSVSIITGYTVIDSSTGKSESKAVETKLSIKRLSDQEIRNYIKTKDPLDKAGAFAIQEIGAVLIERIEGDFLGAMGLPLFDLSKTLNKFGIHIL